jgi:hypothetical protein
VKVRTTVIAGLAVFALLLGVQRSPAQGTPMPGALPQTAMPSAIRVPAAAQPSDHFDVEAATDAYLAEIPVNARAKSDAYFEGGYWLILWDFLYGVALYICCCTSVGPLGCAILPNASRDSSRCKR